MQRGAVMKKLMTLAAGLVGIVALAVAARGGCLPEQDGGYVKVHFARTPGVGDFNTHPAVDLDGKKLTAEEAKQLRKLIDDASFFDLSSSPTPPPYIPDPLAGYDLTVDMDGRTHHIWVMDSAVSKSLKPLVDWLTAREKALPVEFDPLRFPEKALEEEQPAIHVKFTQSGGIAGVHFELANIDSTNLPADDAQKLAKILKDVRFFDLPEEYPTHGADLFEFTITVEMNGKRHTVSYSEDTVPAELKPLIDWLSTPTQAPVRAC
jgi:hypothetical protein